MSLLEDIFLQDEAGEAQELERVIEGDEYEERRRSGDDSDDNSVRGDDEAEEEKTRVDPAKTKQPHVVKNPRFVLNPARLTGPRGIQVIPEHFKDFKFKGKGHEKEDLDLVLKKLEHWAYRLYPKFKFEDCLKKIETLGKKRPVMVHLHKIRNDQITSEETVVQQDSSDDEERPAPPPEEDEFDKLLRQQIDLARSQPAPGSAERHDGVTAPGAAVDVGTPFTRGLMPKATSSPSISDEQRERMLENRRKAEERRLAKVKRNNTDISETTDANDKASSDKINENNDKVADFKTVDTDDSTIKQNRRNAIDSGDEEIDLTDANHTTNVDNIQIDKENSDKVVDITASNLYTQRKHKSNVTDSSGEEIDLTEANHTTTNIEFKENSEKVVDLTVITVNTQKKHKSNVIDSSDEEIDLTEANHITTVDNIQIDERNSDKVVDLTDRTVNTQRKDDSKLTNSSTEEADLIEDIYTEAAKKQANKDANHSKVIDLSDDIERTNRKRKSNGLDEEIYLNTRKINTNEPIDEDLTENIAVETMITSNIDDSDSSDDDFNATAVNQSVTVDVHKSSDDNRKSKINDRQIFNGDIFRETCEEAEIIAEKSKDLNEIETAINKENFTNNIPKENIESEKTSSAEVDIDAMDVDFSEDF